jgi:hypothetical protein
MNSSVVGSGCGFVLLMASVSFHCVFHWSKCPIGVGIDFGCTLAAWNIGHWVKKFWLIAFTHVCVVGLNMLVCRNLRAVNFREALYVAFAWLTDIALVVCVIPLVQSYPCALS